MNPFLIFRFHTTSLNASPGKLSFQKPQLEATLNPEFSIYSVIFKADLKVMPC